MKKLIKTLVITLVLININQCSRNSDNEDLQNLPAITAEEKNDLTFMFEEEKLARDTYLFLHQKWNLQEFANIKNSEQSHMNAIENLLIKYNIPYQKLPEGKFENSNLQTLYNQLITQGSISNKEALKVGSTIEDVDIKDLNNLSAKTKNTLILNVYSKLTCGSRNHMRTFTNSLEILGEEYSPQFISQTEYDLIINSSNESCGK